MRKYLVAVVALSLVGMMPAVSEARPTKAAVQIGAKCTKSGATTKVGSTNVICKQNSKKVLVWTKVVETQECKAAKARYATQLKSYQDIVAKIGEAKAAAAGLTGAEADKLRAQISETEDSVKLLQTLVDSLSGLTLQICKLG